jgi:hypothetical protein
VVDAGDVLLTDRDVALPLVGGAEMQSSARTERQAMDFQQASIPEVDPIQIELFRLFQEFCVSRHLLESGYESRAPVGRNPRRSSKWSGHRQTDKDHPQHLLLLGTDGQGES